MLTETLTFGDKVLTTIAIAIVVFALGAVMWALGYALWSMVDWIADKFGTESKR